MCSEGHTNPQSTAYLQHLTVFQVEESDIPKQTFRRELDAEC